MKRTLKASLVVSLLLLAGTAQAHQLCLPHEEAIARLQRDYGETAQGLGLGNRGQSVVELFTSRTGSWTILVTRTNGLSCITASGENWTPTETEIPQMAPPIADNGSTTGNPRKSPARGEASWVIRPDKGNSGRVRILPPHAAQCHGIPHAAVAPTRWPAGGAERDGTGPPPAATQRANFGRRGAYEKTWVRYHTEWPSQS